ncbi:PREDICTED: uncharacterized protein LOC109239278 [Nicotiana attenuata]|uniref:uncharacterized protein LOC109239278 n=1 Tax=Nicotiana attenuata TaxID=49451 RepID=UPI000904B184|nr:PREDICTED: uncharacterized protein LOC109239278 [Nicotiana attenuata]
MRSAVQLLTCLVVSQAQRQNTGAADIPVSARVRDFINIDPLVFTGSDPKEDPQTFIDQVHHTLQVMHASDMEEVESSVRPQSSRSSAPPIASALPQFQSLDMIDLPILVQVRICVHWAHNITDTSLMRDQCGKAHFGLCRRGSDACYSCGQPGHMMQDFPNRGGGGMSQPTGSVSGSSLSVRPPARGFQPSTGCGRGRGAVPSLSGAHYRTYALVGR